MSISTSPSCSIDSSRVPKVVELRLRLHRTMVTTKYHGAAHLSLLGERMRPASRVGTLFLRTSSGWASGTISTRSAHTAAFVYFQLDFNSRQGRREPSWTQAFGAFLALGSMWIL